MTHTPTLVKIGKRWVDSTDIRTIDPDFEANEIIVTFHTETPNLYIANTNGNLEKVCDQFATAVNLARQGAPTNG